MKSAIEFLRELPEGYRELALDAVEKWPLKPHVSVGTIPSAICTSFVINGRNEIKQWAPFWHAVIDHYLSGSPLPPLPPLPAEYYWKRRCEAAEAVISKPTEANYKKWEQIKNEQP